MNLVYALRSLRKKLAYDINWTYLLLLNYLNSVTKKGDLVS